ncbi:MAG TPA: choice-of-anchor I family protein, partial [Saprospiraceae bacterium]|nr:choice-of-anchor I family protein [Saprospiraceae bacterium]
MKKIFTRFSTTLLLLSTCLLLVGSAWTQTTITQWNFNGESATTVPGGTTSPTTAVGTGTASLVGGTTATFASGVANGGSTDPVITAPPNYGWNVTTFAAQSMGNKERGVQFLVSTVGFQNIQVRWDQRHSNTSARHVRLQYTTDGSTWVDFGTLYEGTSGDTWFNGRSANLSTITAANNNANFGIRIVAEFAPSTTNYAPSQSTGTYGATSTWRFDMVTISGTAIPATTCSITGISASNISACDGKNTHNTGDDTFTADVTVTFTNPPSTGNLVLSGDGSASVAVGSLSTATSHTFVGVTMPADGGAIGLTATFSADTPCSFTNNNAGTAPAACSPTCNDGIQNGDETDVDCGGATCPPCGPVVDCPSLTGAPTVVDESCAGAADGSITINATSSSQPLEYALDEEGPFQSSNQFTGLSAGCYKITIQTQTCAVTTMVIVRNSSPTVSPQVKELAFSPVSQLNTGGTEIIAYDSASKRLFSTNGANMRVDIIDFSNPSSPNVIGAINMLSDPNSVAVKNGIVAIAVANGQNPGSVIFADINGNVLNTVTVGALPDMLVFTPDGQKVLVANEGEPNNSYTIDPEGSISIIDISGGVASATVATADFSAYIGQEAALRAQGIRIFGPGANAAQDFEPEFITISEDGTTAYVALQENNAIAIVDIASATVTDIKPLGYKDHSLPSNALDPSDRDVDGTTASGGKININTWKVLGMYQPDGITPNTVGNETSLVTANEGDARDYTGFSEEIRVGSNNYPLDPTRFPNATQL